MTKAIARRIIRFTAGLILFLGGIVGLVLPGLQGILMIVIGLGLMSPDIPPLRRLGRRLKARYPRQAAALEVARERLAERWHGRSFLRSRRTAKPAKPAPGPSGAE